MTAIVLGLDLNGLGVVRALGSSGIDVIGVDNVLSHAGRASRYCREVMAASPTAADDLIPALRKIAEGLGRPGVLFPTMDDTVRILSQHRGELPERLRVALPEASMTARLMEKEDLAELAARHGWPAPFTCICRSEADVASAAASFPYPGVMKPGRRELDAPRGIPQKVWTFSTPDELFAAYRTLSRWEKKVVLQEVVPGPDSAVLFCLFYADRRSRPRALFVGHKIRQFPPLYGSTSSAEPIEAPDVRDFAVKYISDVAYQGLGSVEMKADARTGRPLLIEPTVGRTDYQSFVAVANGVNIPAIAYRDLADLDPIESPRRAARPVKYVVGLRDLRSAARHVREGRETWRGFVLSLRGPKAFALLQPRDPGPFLYRIHYATLGRAARLARGMVGRLTGAPPGSR
jgi:predicted ATP-grasp superfamily ATP-dependent carboligase